MTLQTPAELVPYQLSPQSPELGSVLQLIRSSFAFMDGRIDPPSSMHDLTLEKLEAQAETYEIWVCGTPALACVFLSFDAEALYLGKLAVANAHRGRGLARQLVRLAHERARQQGLAFLELQVRIELIENQAAFAHMGFKIVGETAHTGFDYPTSVTMRRRVED